MVEAIIENGVSSDILKVGLANLVPANRPEDEAYRLDKWQISILETDVGRENLVLRRLA